MRCLSCNVALTDAESVRKNKETGKYYDLCADCYHAYKENLNTIQEKPDEILGWDSRYKTLIK